KTNVNTVDVHSIGYSDEADDVTVSLVYTPSGGSPVTLTYDLSIDSPYQLVPQGVTHQGLADSDLGCYGTTEGTDGYQTQVSYEMLSFFGKEISHIGVNETFSNVVDDYIGNNWPGYDPAYLGAVVDKTVFTDGICYLGPTATPPSLPPQTP